MRFATNAVICSLIAATWVNAAPTPRNEAKYSHTKEYQNAIRNIYEPQTYKEHKYDADNHRIYSKPSLSRDEQTYGEDEYIKRKLQLDGESGGISTPVTDLDDKPDSKQTTGNTDPTNDVLSPIDTDSNNCSNIKAALVSQGLHAEAIICLDKLLVIYPFKAVSDESQQEMLAQVVSLIGGGSSSDEKELLTCSAIRAHLRVLGIQVDAEVCLTGLIQINL
ncbi:hypothetical protein K7432_004738 [Basidiobolus ranarum]|uniref:Uncharacterized protein n=1 Tax=Basidiobolus ranarum TaxID=34480 RepID=A0ABR2W4Q3_9FUNG